MERSEAHNEALTMLRRRIATGWWPRDRIEQTIFEGASPCRIFPHGYLMASGKLSIPSPCGAKHEGEGIHTFSIRALLDEIESPQAGLFV